VCYCRAGLVVVVIKRDRRTGVVAIPHQKNALTLNLPIVVKQVLITGGIAIETGVIAMSVKCHLFLSAQSRVFAKWALLNGDIAISPNFYFVLCPTRYGYT
jgi:hypothetical protein